MLEPLAPPPGAAGPAPKVRLVNAFAVPFDNAVATARTCYAARVITPDDVGRDERSRAQRDAIARSTYAAGHHTTLQHATFQFVLEDVSRQCLWSFLHAHPFYNSEQVSQRYVAVRPERCFVPAPLRGAAAALYGRTLRAQMACYQALVTLLTPAAAAAYFAVFPARRKHAEAHAGAVRKKAQEVARYALPVATYAHLYHTVSGLTLHRYHRLCNMLDVPAETRAVVAAMVAAVAAHDPLFFRDAEDPLPLEATSEHAALVACGRRPVDPTAAAAFVREFDAELAGDGDPAACARLVDFSGAAEATLGRAVRAVLGLPRGALSDGDAIARLLSPACNPQLAGALNLAALGKLGRCLTHVRYTFQKKLSHSADSQDQRHRLTPGSRPVLATQYVGGRPDVVVPPLLAGVPAAADAFAACMAQTWDAIDALLSGGADPADALYLLPNAFPVRFYSSGDLLGWHHKWTTRLCFNAQDEIWAAARQEVLAVRAVHPQIGAHLAPPCGLRQAARRRPLCPEGPRYCGVPVWKQQVADFRRLI